MHKYTLRYILGYTQVGDSVIGETKQELSALPWVSDRSYLDKIRRQLL